jgi:hypothetical protein
MRLFKLKEDTQSIINLEVAHQYLRLLEGSPTLHCVSFERIFAKFGDSYTLVDVYNISKKLELAHAQYEANTMRPPSHSRLEPPPTKLIKSSFSSSRAKTKHSTAPILPFYNYCGNLAHKANECNIPSKDFFMIIVKKKDIMKLFIFAKFPRWEQLRLPWRNLPTFSATPQPKAKAPQPST